MIIGPSTSRRRKQSSGARERIRRKLTCQHGFDPPATAHASFESGDCTCGRITRTDVAVCYIRGLAPDPVVEEVKIRLKRIDIDSVLDSAMVEELIEDHPFLPFPK